MNAPSAANSLDDPADRELGRQLATLVFAASGSSPPGQVAQAVACRNVLARLGFDLPLCVVADFAQVFLTGSAFPARPPADRAPLERPPTERRADRRSADILIRYEGVLRAASEVAAVADTARRGLSVDLVAVLIARLLGDCHQQFIGRTAGRRAVRDLALAAASYATAPAELARQYDPAWALSFLAVLGSNREIVLARAEQLDLGPLRLLGMFPSTARLDLLDLYRLMSTPAPARAVDFSLQLLPSVLETRRGASAQRYAIDGYASVERRGSIDTLLPSELAHDAEVFAHKAFSDELLYYGRERREESVLREHWVLVDASASMRGSREAFARGLAIALGKKLHLQGDAVSLRFFDSRLHRKIPLGAAAGHELPHVLCFRSERGRHYARVFDELLHEARRTVRRGQHGLAITFLTHGECHIPVGLVESLREVARVCAVFILPSRPLRLAYLGALHRHEVVDAADFAEKRVKAVRALAIVDRVSQLPTVADANSGKVT